MGRSRVESERVLREQVERMTRRSATVSQIVHEYAAPLDLPGWIVLRLVDEHGPVRSSELAQRSRMSRPSVSRCLAGLEDGGFVVSSPDPGDGRASLVSVTEDGRGLLAHLAELGGERIRAVTEDFTAAEVETLARLLTRFNDKADDLAVVPSRYRRGSPVR